MNDGDPKSNPVAVFDNLTARAVGFSPFGRGWVSVPSQFGPELSGLQTTPVLSTIE